MMSETTRRLTALLGGALISALGAAVTLAAQPGPNGVPAFGTLTFYAATGIMLLNLPGNLSAAVLFMGLASASPLVLKMIVPVVLNWMFWSLVIWLSLTRRRVPTAIQ